MNAPANTLTHLVFQKHKGLAALAAHDSPAVRGQTEPDVLVALKHKERGT